MCLNLYYLDCSCLLRWCSNPPFISFNYPLFINFCLRVHICCDLRPFFITQIYNYIIYYCVFYILSKIYNYYKMKIEINKEYYYKFLSHLLPILSGIYTFLSKLLVIIYSSLAFDYIFYWNSLLNLRQPKFSIYFILASLRF